MYELLLLFKYINSLTFLILKKLTILKFTLIMTLHLSTRDRLQEIMFLLVRNHIELIQITLKMLQLI